MQDLALAPYIYTGLLILTLATSYIVFWAIGIIKIPDSKWCCK